MQLTISLKMTKEDNDSLFELRTVGCVGFCSNAVVSVSVYAYLVLE